MGARCPALLACAWLILVAMVPPTACHRDSVGSTPLPPGRGGSGAAGGSGLRMGPLHGIVAAFACVSGTPGSLPGLHRTGRGILGRGGRPGRHALGRGGLGILEAALGLRLVTTSKTREKWADTACDDYAGRVKKMGVAMEQVVLKPAPGPPKFTAEQQKEEEGKSLLARVDTGSEHLIVLDERGSLLTSHELASLLQGIEDKGVRVATFAIGGAHGHSQGVRDKAHHTVSLSKMVMNHQVAKVVLMEQIYRAYTILRGVPYHK